MNRYMLAAAFVAFLNWPLATPADTSATHGLESAWLAADGANLDGDVVQLAAAERNFIAIHRAHTTRKPLGAVVLLHDNVTNANSLEVIRPLRIGLSEAGWDTLSLQLPAAYPGQPVAKWPGDDKVIAARLQAALAWLEQRIEGTRVVLALGASAPAALRFAAGTTAEDLHGLVLVSTATDLAADADRTALEKLQRPLLDIFAERDIPPVTAAAAGRLRAARASEIDNYHQRTVSGATAGYRGLDEALLATVRAWLRTHASENGN